MKKILTMVIISILVLATLIPVSIFAATSDSDTSTDVAKRALAINAPSAVVTGENFKLQVIDKYSGAPVSGAGVWAVKFDNADSPAVDVASSVSE